MSASQALAQQVVTAITIGAEQYTGTPPTKRAEVPLTMSLNQAEKGFLGVEIKVTEQAFFGGIPVSHIYNYTSRPEPGKSETSSIIFAVTPGKTYKIDAAMHYLDSNNQPANKSTNKTINP